MAPIPERIAWAVDLLGDAAPATLLEVGCGNGVAMALVCERTDAARVTGLDRSAAAIARARSRLARHLASGRASLVHGALEDGVAGERFARVLAINVNLYWTQPDAAFDATRALLAPGGSLQLVYEPPSGRLATLERQLGGLIASNGWELASRHTARWGSSAGVALVARPQGA